MLPKGGCQSGTGSDCLTAPKDVGSALKMKLLINDYESELRALASDAVEIRVLIAFLTEGGLGWLPKEKYQNSEFIVGVNLGITTSASLKTLQVGGADVRVFCDPKRMFHPKAIYLKGAETESLIVGSNNLTAGGISSNYELSILQRRSEDNEDAFLRFLSHFDYLQSHDYCFPPDDDFYRDYIQSQIQSDLAKNLTRFVISPRAGRSPLESWSDENQVGSFGDCLRLLGHDFPRLDRSQGLKIRDHPLKKLNEEEIRPLFAGVIERASRGRLTGRSSLNTGGKWFKIPLIEAIDEKDEPWEKASNRGRLVLQVHFSDDYKKVSSSLVLQYLRPISQKDGTMPPLIADRFERQSEHLESFRHSSIFAPDHFRLWSYPEKKFAAWAKPILSFDYLLASLPPDETLCNDLAALTTAFLEASTIN